MIFHSYRTNGGENWLRPATYQRRRLTTTLCAARRRAKKKGVPFDISTEYLASIFPKDWKCPALRIELHWGAGDRKNSPSLDRIDPSKGYVRGNVCWLSQMANQIKTDATTAQICAVADYLKGLQNCS